MTHCKENKMEYKRRYLNIFRAESDNAVQNAKEQKEENIDNNRRKQQFIWEATLPLTFNRPYFKTNYVCKILRKYFGKSNFSDYFILC